MTKRSPSRKAGPGPAPRDIGRQYWAVGGLLVLIMAAVFCHDIARPINGLHSWGDAHGAWFCRAHLKYGLGYTKGLVTWAVGDPPPQPPSHYLDHPQLGVLLNTAIVAPFGKDNDFSIRIVKLVISIVSLLMLLKLLRGLLDDRTALLAGAFVAALPLTGYFGFGSYHVPLGLLATYCYLAMLGELRGAERRGWHLWVMGLCLFLTIQVRWWGFFYAAAIGMHYVCRCIRRRHWPEWKLLAVVAVAPLVSLVVVFATLIVARGGDWRELYEVFKWRTKALKTREQGEVLGWAAWWAAWLARFAALALMDFTWPVLTLAGAGVVYTAAGRAVRFLRRRGGRAAPELKHLIPQFWLLMIVPLTQFVFLKGSMWHHHYWLRPLMPIVGIAAACAVTALWDVLRKAHVALAGVAVALVGLLCVYRCFEGTRYYYSIIQHPAAKVEMLQRLRAAIPPDKALLSFQSFRVEEHGAKKAHYRPQIAWYLDREIVESRSLADIHAKAATGRFPYYVAPAVRQLTPLLQPLAQRYPIVQQVEAVPRVPGVWPDESMPLNRGSLPYLVFDLAHPKR